MYGSAVPFHISTIKNVTKTEEGSKVVLRINFQSPGQIAGKKEDMVSLTPTFYSFARMGRNESGHVVLNPVL